MDHAEKINFKIREQAWIARLAAYILKGKKVAIVIGNTIYLHGAEEAELLESKSWLRHELMHVKQFKKEGVFRFLAKYTWESIRKGYYKNAYEVEAREAEERSNFEELFKVISRHHN